MSAQNGVLVPCEAIQDKLVNYWNTCSGISEPTPLYDFLLSGLNRTNTLQSVVSPGDGKIKTVRLVYTPRILRTSVTKGATHPTCTATTVRGNRWTDYTLDTTSNYQIEEKLTLTDFERICDPNDQLFAEKIANMLDAIDLEAAYELSAEAVALAGGWGTDVQNVDASDNLEVPTLRTGTTDSLHPFTMQTIQNATQDSGYCDAFGIFSGRTFSNYAGAIQLGCCTDYGMDLAATFAKWGTAVMYDRAVYNAFGDQDNGLVVMNGALQVVTWSLYDRAPWSSFVAGNEQIIKMRTRKGMPVDVSIKWDCGAWHIVMTSTAEVKAMPYDMFQAGDPFNGVNFVNKLEVVNS